ncbi:MAG TPA: FAD-dependent monooxygenase, partial [Gammaproteobacteria bacterium]|nr:FAD-dependent monooxygenase [Gammaproteobacteria bacterium]
MLNTIPVLIVGAGPTGMSMAIELKRHGIAFRIIDKQTKPVPTSNALAAQTRMLEVWEDQGLLRDALTRGNIIKGFNFYAKNKNIIHID